MPFQSQGGVWPGTIAHIGQFFRNIDFLLFFMTKSNLGMFRCKNLWPNALCATPAPTPFQMGIKNVPAAVLHSKKKSAVRAGF